MRKRSVVLKGISLRTAALLANEDDSIAASATKKRWHNNREPKLPKPLGKLQNDSPNSQTNLYDPTELLEFIRLADPNVVDRVREGYSEHLKPVRQTV